jgi:methyltransferase (TIGR00027 family)
MAIVAVEQHVPAELRLVRDDLAIRFLPPAARWLVGACRWPAVRRLFMRLSERQAPGIWGNTLCRKRYIDERVTAAIGDRLPQLVTLGAGFDTRAYRLAAPAGVPAFEVDLPTNSGAKQQRLREVYGHLPARVSLVPLDLDVGDVGAALAAHGFRADRPAIFVWEAVSQYLTDAGVRTTLAFLAGAAANSRLIFTFVRHDFLDGSNLYGADRIYQQFVVKQVWHFGIAPEQVAGLLAEYGWTEREQVGRADYERRYLAPLGRVLPVTEIERVVYAQKR